MAANSSNLYTYPDEDSLLKDLRKYVINCQNGSLNRHDTFRVAVSGGSLPRTLSKALLAPSSGTPEDSIQFSKWDVFFADERAVPLEHPDSNYLLVKEELFDKIPPELGTPKVHSADAVHIKDDDPQEAADLYQDELMRVFAAKDSVKLPVFDLVLLGVGPDGHTCSLFPNHPILDEVDAWVAAVTNSPKPPAKRITFTLPVVTHALNIAFVVTGSSKKEILKDVFDLRGQTAPCALVNTKGGNKVIWFTDRAATEGIQYPKKSSL